MRTRSIAPTSRKRHLFRPILGDGLRQSGLEPRSLAAPWFNLAKPAESGTLQTNSSSTAIGNNNWEANVDSAYGHTSDAASQATGRDQFNNSAASSADARATVDGPGTNNQGDPQQFSSSTINVAIVHDAVDSYTNATGQPFGVWQGEGSDTGAGTKFNSPDYNYRVQGGAAGVSTVSISFTASLSGTTATPQLFTEWPSLSLEVQTGPMRQWLNVGINYGSTGYTATGINLQGTVRDPNFGQGPPNGIQTEAVSATIPNVVNGTDFHVYMDSKLETGTKLATFPVGTSSNTSLFTWNLKIQVS